MNMLFTVDDLCLSHLDNFKYLDNIKLRYPDFKITAFTIANYEDREPLDESELFLNWYDEHKNWVEIAVHSYDHKYPPDGDRENEGYWIAKALDKLRVFLPTKYGYRSPGWQTTNKTVSILKDLGFQYIAYETMVKNIQNNEITERTVFNSHLYDVDSMQRLGVRMNEILRS